MEEKDKKSFSVKSSRPYGNYTEYLDDELRKLDIILEIAFEEKREAAVEPDIYMPADYVAKLFSNPGTSRISDKTLEKRFEEKCAEVESRLKATGDESDFYPLCRLFRFLSLQEIGKFALLVAIAPLIDSKYDKIYGFLNNSISSGGATRRLAGELLMRRGYSAGEVGSLFSENGELVSHGLILFDERSELGSSARHYFVEPRLAQYLISAEYKLMSGNESIVPQKRGASLDDLHITESTADRLEKIQKLFIKDKNGFDFGLFTLSGEGELSKKNSVIALMNKADTGLVVADTSSFLQIPGSLQRKIHMIIRDAVITESALYFTTPPQDALDLFQAILPGLIQEVSRFGIPVFLSIPSVSMIPKALIHYFYHIDFPVPGYTIRKKIWGLKSKELQGLSEESLAEFANRYHFTEEQIHGAVEYAAKRAAFNGGSGIDDASLLEGCRIQSNDKLASMGKSLETPYGINDIILPENLYEQLFEIVNQYKYKHQVYEEWGFGKKVAYGRGITVLFSGPSGTGKTMAASVIGNELKLHTYKIDLSTVISKYIGETEKNLSRIFHEASTSNSILFFDEADAIFGKRTEVKDSHDRYANLEVSYLLQKMEEYEGITILASNLRQNIDEAFFRRMQFVLEFPFPNAEYRQKIWERMIPEQAPKDNAIDYKFLADKLEVAGGNIKNIVLNAAFIASGETKEIGMRHLILAAKKEYKKLNKSFMKNEFDPYYDLIENPKLRKVK